MAIPRGEFLHEDAVWLRAVPSKALFNSTLIHEVINRGDFFAVRKRDGLLTIMNGSFHYDPVKEADSERLEAIKQQLNAISATLKAKRKSSV